MNSEKIVQCRIGCGACCIVPSISSPIPDMPNGKPAGIRCVQLDEHNKCKLFGLSERPKVCLAFNAQLDTCGHTHQEAVWLLTEWERATGH